VSAMPCVTMGSEIENKLLKIIARQTLSGDDATWLKENIRKSIDWPVVIDKALEEGLTSFLYFHCRNLSILTNLPESSRKLLARIYAETLLINRHMIKVLEELGEHLKKYEFPVIVLKGAALLERVYSDIGLRPMEDIDLMVQPESLDDVRKILKDMGFYPDQLYPNTYRRGIISIDLHTDFLSTHRIRSRREIMNIQYEDVWTRAISIRDNDSSLFRLSLYDNLISLSSHLLKHGLRRLIWFVDIKESIERNNEKFDWLDLIRHFRMVGAEKNLLYFLLLAKHLLEMNVPDYVLDALGKNNLSAFEKYTLRLRLANAPLGLTTEILWLFQIRGWGKRIQFITENIFPKNEIMNQIFPSFSPSSLNLLRRFANIFSQFLCDFSSSLKVAFKGRLPPL